VLREGARPVTLRQADFDAVLAEMNAEHQSLTRALLGGSGGEAGPADAGPPGAFRRPRRIR